MGGLCLGLAAAVDHANARHGASAVIRVTDDAPKGGIANFAIHQYLGDSALLFFGWHVDQGDHVRVRVSWVQLQSDRVLRVEGLRKPARTMAPNSTSEMVLIDLP